MQGKIVTLIAFLAISAFSFQTVMGYASYPYVLSFGTQGLVKTGVFTYPQHVAVDDSGNVYVTDLGNARVQKFDNDGQFLHSWGSKGTGKTEFHAPEGIAVGKGYVYVVDHELNVIKKFDTNGNFITSWGGTGVDNGYLKLPTGIAVSKDNFVYVVDTGNSRIQKFDTNGKFVSVIGSSGTGDGQFLTPLDVAIDSNNNIFVTDNGYKKILKFNSDGVYLSSYTSSFGGIKLSPDGIDIDSDSKMIVADSGNNRIVVLDGDGKTVASFGKTGTGNSQFKMPKGIATDLDGDLFVVDSSNHRIQKFGSQDNMTESISVSTTQTTKINSKSIESEQNNPVTVTRTIVNDLKKPNINPPKDLYVEATGGLTRISIGQAIAIDDSGIKSLTNNAPNEFPLGTTTVIWTAIDNSGNVGIATQTITVVDSTPPLIYGLSDISQETKGLENSVNLGYPKVDDLVGVLSITNDAPETFRLGETVVTWTAVDVAKNEATAIQTITIIDTKPPKVIAPADINSEATSLDKNMIILGEPIISDDSEIYSITNDAPEFFPLGETTVTWTVSDVSGNLGSAKQKVTIVDTSKPKILPMDSAVVEAISEKNNSVTLIPPNVTDVQIVKITNDAPEFFPLGETIVTWTATDLSGNNSTTLQKINVVDTTAPNLITPPDIIQEAKSKTGNIVSLGESLTTDTTGFTSTVNDGPSEYSLGTTIVTWTASDNFGNTVSKIQNVTIIDTTAPKISSPGKIVFEATSLFENIIDLGIPKTSDSVEVLAITNDAPEFFPLGETTVTWTVSDTSGNTNTAAQIVSVVDTTAPIITIPENIIKEADSLNTTKFSIGDAVANDLNKVESITNDAPEFFPLGETIVTWTATDGAGNTSTATQKITIVDTTKPEISKPSDITQEATSKLENTVTLETPLASDNVRIESITNDAPEFFPLGETIVTWTATDGAGNTSTATQKITIVDTTKPEISKPSDITQEAISKLENTVTLETPLASDNVGIESITNDAPEFFPLGETIVTWTATDSVGLLTTASQKVIIVDTTKPEIHISNVEVEATSESMNTVDLGEIKTTDKVEVTSITNDAPENFKLGVTIVTWTVTDESGNSASVQQSVTVHDYTSPIITPPSDISTDAKSSDKNIILLGNPIARDTVSNVSITNDAPEFFPLGETTVTWTATDSSGNAVNATQKVILTDMTSPIIKSPVDVIQEATSLSNNLVNLGDAQAEDAIGIESITNDAPEFFPLGETIVTWTATDGAGNTSTATQKITIVDTTKPEISKPSDITQEATSKLENTVTLETPLASDNVRIESITNDAPEFFPLGETIVTWTATDGAGNLESISQKIIIQDTISPKFAKISDVVVEATSKDSNSISLQPPVVTDISDIKSLINDAPEKFSLGETMVIWTAADDAGNESFISQKVTVIDTSSPVLTIPDDVVTDLISIRTPVIVGLATATDLTDDHPKITNDAPDTFPIGQTTVTWIAQDKFGNSMNKTQIVTIQACGKPESTYNLIIGTEDDDTLVGTNLADLIISLGGDDIITGGKGNDCIISGDGDDIVYGNEGNDNINAGDGNDILKGQSGDDILVGLTGTDILDGGDDSDSCIVSENDDDIMIKCE